MRFDKKNNLKLMVLFVTFAMGLLLNGVVVFGYETNTTEAEAYMTCWGGVAESSPDSNFDGSTDRVESRNNSNDYFYSCWNITDFNKSEYQIDNASIQFYCQKIYGYTNQTYHEIYECDFYDCYGNLTWNNIDSYLNCDYENPIYNSTNWNYPDDGTLINLTSDEVLNSVENNDLKCFVHSLKPPDQDFDYFDIDNNDFGGSPTDIGLKLVYSDIPETTTTIPANESVHVIKPSDDFLINFNAQGSAILVIVLGLLFMFIPAMAIYGISKR